MMNARTINTLRRCIIGTIRFTGSQEKTASLAGVAQGTISRAVNGADMRASTWARIARGLRAFWEAEAGKRARARFKYTDARPMFADLFEADGSANKVSPARMVLLALPRTDEACALGGVAQWEYREDENHAREDAPAGARGFIHISDKLGMYYGAEEVRA